jgi:PilZ domain-containing protein
MTADVGATENKGIVERRFPRFAVELPCLYSQGTAPDSNGTAVNVSRGGCAIRGLTPVQKGDYLRIRLFPSPTLSPIEIGLAPVRWATDDYFGVEFITLTFRDAKRLQAYLTLIEADHF